MILAYIAGRLTPRDSTKNPAIEYMQNVEKMLSIEVELVGLGIAVVNPGSDFLLLLKNPNIPLDTLREVSIEKMKRCDVAIFLPGWRQSEGAQAEHKIATECKIPVVDLDQRFRKKAVNAETMALSAYHDIQLLRLMEVIPCSKA